MRDYIIMTDSCCSLNRREVDELGITVLPLSFTMEGKTYLDTPDHADMSPETFFQKIADGVDCTTAAVNVGQFTDAMTSALTAGKDILCISFSSALSTTYQSACIAAEDLRAEHPEAKIIVIDSLSACRGQGMLIYRTVRERREKNLDIEALADFVRGTIQHQDHWFMVDDLNHLKHGGRVSAAAALAGTVLGIKPVMHTDSEGKLTPVSKARGSRGALRALVEENAGFITSNEEWGSGEYTRHMILNIRVPASSLDSFMERAKAIGSVISSAITETDVTDRYTDTDRRLKAYQKQYDRVLDMMDQAQTVDELIQIESELSRLELNIEDCQGALNYWDERIQYSSVTIYVDEVKRAAQEDQPLSLQMQNALEDSWETFTENAKETLVNTYAELPYIVTWLIVLVIVGGVVLIVVLTRRRKKRK